MLQLKKKIRWITTTFFLITAIAFSLSAQDAKLAAQYYRDGEYEKASILYQKLYTSNNNTYYFDKYIECLLNLERYDQCENILKREIKRNPKDVELYVTYGNVLERQFREEEAEKQYQQALKKLPAQIGAITKLANAFVRMTKYEYAIQTYERGKQLIGDKYSFAYNLGNLYQRKGDTPKMVENYLASLQERPSRLNNLKRLFENYLEEEDYLELQSQIYGFIQEYPDDNIHFIELLTWSFIQQKDYRNALRQSKALDRRLEESGGRVYRLAQTAAIEKNYDAAIEAYQYLIDEKGPGSTYYIDAKRESLSSRRKKVTEGFDYTQEDLLTLEAQYEEFLQEFGKNRSSATIIAELADLEAFYLNDLDKAISLLEEMIEFPGIDRDIRARAKISLADFYLIKGERWEATLLYSQVDKEFKDDLLGHEARFRNAKLSYYFGDFQWAQSQFEVLKASTSKLIANDALDLSVFIMDNLGLDTTATSLEMYAEADLLAFQNKYDEAFLTLDKLLEQFPEHSLQDDVLYTKARIYKKLRDYDQAVTMYEKIIEEFPEDIRADNSLFELAELYEQILGQPEKAQQLYEKLFLDYSGSTFAVEARKRYRKLRGDNL